MRGERPFTATYRVQLNAHLTLRDALGVVPYLHELGVSHLYCSPVLAARSGSTHGYDVVDPTRLNPSLGSEDDLRALAIALHEREMGLLLDIVPNHMAASAENPYWDDVLGRGRSSPYAWWFDIDWSSSGGARVVLPVLGDTLDRVIDRGELSVRIDARHRARLLYFDNSFPIDPATMEPHGQPSRAVWTSDRLQRLLEQQHYRLTHWKNPGNYRRFFDVNDLVALRMEDAAVFEATHALILKWVRDGVVDGLRVDHIDGLADPAEYLGWLRMRGARLVVVEKILADGERLPLGWPVAGTTGYDFLNDLDDVFLDPVGMGELERFYDRLRKLHGRGFSETAYDAKRRVMASSLRGDVQRLARRFRRALAGRSLASPSQAVARAALSRWVAALPVYRTYVVPWEEPTERSAFVQRLQQLSGAAAAKGVEDSAFYQYMPLVSRNEVGGAPNRPLEMDAARRRFHAGCAARASHWPLGLTCTTTHDTKRSADVRSRLSALTEVAPEWERAVFRWRRLNRRHRTTVRGRLIPDTNTEYLIYQTLVGIWPGPRVGRRLDDLPDPTTLASMAERLDAYMLKAAREAKVHTSWREPEAAYEAALRRFVRLLFERPNEEPFLGDVARAVGLVGWLGHWNTLARVAVHLTAPGTPDLYQGDELRDLELVDPDNRHAVNFAFLSRALAETENGINPFDSRFKLLAIRRLLALRRRQPALFEAGAYIPLSCEGPRATHVLAFARRSEGAIAITAVGRLLRELWSLPESARQTYWEGTELILPEQFGPQYTEILSDSAVSWPSNRLPLSSVFIHLPTAVLSSSYLAGSTNP